jgi:hypothetical protein
MNMIQQAAAGMALAAGCAVATAAGDGYDALIWSTR